MATATTTTSMDAMIDSLKRVSWKVQKKISRADLSEQRASLRTMKSMVLAASTICSMCKSVLERGNVSSIPEDSVDHSDVPSSSSRPVEECSHYSLDDLARAAIQGCHLCLIVYLGLDSDALKEFARALTTTASPTEAWSESRCGKCSKKTTPATVGFVSITPISHDQALLSFRYTQAPFVIATEATEGLSEISASLVSSPDSADFEYRRASMTPSRSQTISPITLTSGPSFSPTYGDLEPSLRVDLTLVTPQRTLELGTRMIPTESTTTASDDGFDLVKDWIRECTENHFDCNGGATADTTKQRPTYLLDVSIRDSTNKAGVKLIAGNLLDIHDEYLTLSHPWGATKPVRLHRGTLPALSQGVAQSNLLQAIADAAMVTAKLGYRYLWVDALCMPHDDDQAFAEEMARVHWIYGNAALNVAAACASGDDDGFVLSRNVAALRPGMLDVSGWSIQDGTYMVLGSMAWNDLVDRAPLQRRPWVLQERALAKRTLHFTKNQLMWECRQMCCSEIYPKGVPEEFMHSRDADTTENPVSLISTPHKFDKTLHHHQTGNWSQLVEHYSTIRTASASDQLLVISGLARQYCTLNHLQDSDYVAGHWIPELPHSLLWMVKRGCRPAQYRAPTWSWASIDGQICWPRTATTTSIPTACLEILDVVAQTRFNDPFGLCDHTRLRVSGFLARGLLQRRHAYWGVAPCTIQFPRARVRVDFGSVSFDEELPPSTSASDVYVLPVVSRPDVVEGLLLTATKTKGHFTRLGTWRLPVTENNTNCERFRIVMTRDLGVASYEEKRERGKEEVNSQWNNGGVEDTSAVWFAGQSRYVITLL